MFLRGWGRTLALPFLESMLPAIAARAYAPAGVAHRFVGAFRTHGVGPGYGSPNRAQPVQISYVYERSSGPQTRGFDSG